MITLMGSPGSPYTRKMLALLRYRRLPYRLLQGAAARTQGLPQPRVALLPTFYFQNADGQPEAVVDSTPIIRRLESEHAGRAAIASDPVAAFIDYLLEDYADEWLTRAMFHYRWHYAADAEKAGAVLPHWFDFSASREQIARRSSEFVERQTGRLYVVGSNSHTAPVIEASYRRFVVLLNEHLARQPFLMGGRPGASDFAVMGQLTCLARFDPTPSALTLQVAPRVSAWVSLMDDLSGWESTDSDWLQAAAVPPTIRALLAEMGRTYVPVMLANAQAVQQRRDLVATDVEGQTWEQQPFPYQARCVGWIRAEYAKLSTAQQSAVRAILDGTGCEKLL